MSTSPPATLAATVISLINFVKTAVPIYFIDPNPSIQENQHSNLTIIPEKASTGVAKLVIELIGLK